MKSGVFVTGTDTNIGKTVSSALIAAAFSEQRKKVNYWKPIQTGGDSDRETVSKLSGLKREELPKPCYEFPEPMAPARAAAIHQETIQLSRIKSQWDELNDDYFWIVEGAGGLLVPIEERKTMADLAQSLDLPLLIVAGTRLGTMNHFLLTLEAAKARKLKILGVIWMGDGDPCLEESLSLWLSDIYWVQRIPSLHPMSSEKIHTHSDLIPVQKIESFP